MRSVLSVHLSACLPAYVLACASVCLPALVSLNVDNSASTISHLTLTPPMTTSSRGAHMFSKAVLSRPSNCQSASSAEETARGGGCATLGASEGAKGMSFRRGFPLKNPKVLAKRPKFQLSSADGARVSQATVDINRGATRSTGASLIPCRRSYRLSSICCRVAAHPADARRHPEQGSGSTLARYRQSPRPAAGPGPGPEPLS
jgi:hypothetical protein